MCWMLSLTDSKMKSLQVQSLKLRLCKKKSSLFFISVFGVLRFRSIVCSGLRELDLHIQFVVCNVLTCREVRQPLFFFYRRSTFIQETTAASCRYAPLVCYVVFTSTIESKLSFMWTLMKGLETVFCHLPYFCVFCYFSHDELQTEANWDSNLWIKINEAASPGFYSAADAE